MLLIFAKVTGVALAVLGVLTPLFLWRPLVAIYAGCAIYLMATVVYMARQSYRWKKSDFEHAKEREEQDRVWERKSKEVEAKLRGGKSA